MKALISFEESQAVCKAFREMGIETFSNDLKPCSGGNPEWHLQMDCYEAINLMDWDFIGMHPTCTKMALSGNRHYAPGKPKHFERLEAVEWTLGVWETACKKAKYVYMENPMGAMNPDSRLPKPQIIQPYYFGDEFQKTTCLWLKNLPFLYHNAAVNLFDSKVTHVHKGEMVVFPSGAKIPKWYSELQGNGAMRSKTFPGIAKAMADQWGPLLLLNK